MAKKRKRSELDREQKSDDTGNTNKKGDAIMKSAVDYIWAVVAEEREAIEANKEKAFAEEMTAERKVIRKRQPELSQRNIMDYKPNLLRTLLLTRHIIWSRFWTVFIFYVEFEPFTDIKFPCQLCGYQW